LYHQVPDDAVRPSHDDSGLVMDAIAHVAAVKDTDDLTTVTHRALAIALEPSNGRDATALEAVMRELCSVARREGRRAEELIVLFKRVWSDRPELRGRSREEATRLFDQVLTMCIKEYYESQR
jgi:hypothetical protein